MEQRITAQQLAELIMTLPPDRLAAVYEFVLSIKQDLLTPELEDSGAGKRAEEMRAVEEQPDREYQALSDQSRAVVRDAGAEYRRERTHAADATAFAPGSQGTHKPKPISVRALAGYKLWLQYSDGVEGVVDLSHLVGKGVFSFWNDVAAFQKVHIGDHGEIVWNDEVDLCPDSMYLRITGLKPEELFPNLRAEPVYA